MRILYSNITGKMLQFLILAALSLGINAYRPVILVHGLFSNARKMIELEDMILAAHPGTNVRSLNLYPGARSLEPLHRQITALTREVRKIMDQSPEGVHLVCHSQGGLLCRGVVEFVPDHNIHSLILLGSPFLGQFGIPAPLLVYVPFLRGEREALSRWMYSFIAQSTLSFANYWKDPRADYQEEYAWECRIMPILNNNPKARYYNNSGAKQAKKNFLKLHRVVLVGGSGDGVIIPWQSSIGAYYGPDLSIVPYQEQISFKEDWYGLKSMYERGCLHVYNISDVSHSDWHKDKHVFSTAIEKYLD